MTRAALAVGARVDLLDGKACLLQPPREAAVRSLRPHRQHATRLEGGACGAEACEAVEGVIALVDDAFGAVVDVEQDGVPGRRPGSDQLPDIGLLDGDAGVVETAAEHLRHRAACPDDDRRHQFRDDDAGILAEFGQGGAQCKTHVREWYDSPAYQAILALRTENSQSDVVFADGVEHPHKATDVLG